MGTTGLGFAAILPILIGGIVDEFEFARSMVGWISSINILGCAIGGLIATLRIGRNSLLQIIRSGLILLIVFDILSIFCTSESSILLVRFLSGIGGGIVYATALAAFSGLKNSINAFATYVVVYCLWSGLVLIALPFLISAFGIKVGFIILALMAVFSFIISPTLNNVVGEIKTKEFVSLNFLLKNKKVLFGLLSYFFLQLAGGTMWAYCERIGKEAGLTSSFIGFVLGISVVFALIGGLLVIRLGSKVGIIKPLLSGIVIMALGTFALFYANNAAIFLIANCFAGAAWSFVIPYYQQIQSHFDSTGRIVSMGTIINMAGRSAGPAIAAVTLGNSAFYNILWISLLALVLSSILVSSSAPSEA